MRRGLVLSHACAVHGLCRGPPRECEPSVVPLQDFRSSAARLCFESRDALGREQVRGEKGLDEVVDELLTKKTASVKRDQKALVKCCENGPKWTNEASRIFDQA